MILSTPLRPETFVEGQKKSLVRQFWIPVTILTVGAFLAPLPAAQDAEIFAIFAMFAGFLAVGTGAFAYVGMWMGLRLRTANAAFFYTIILLLIAPFPFACFAVVFAWPLGWLVAWAIASVNLSGPSVRKMLTKDSQQNYTFRPPPLPVTR
jgi:hypothetical protein